MPFYSMDMKIKLSDGDELGGQNWLTIGYPGSRNWGICSSNVSIQGLRGTFSYSEKLGFEGTTCFRGDTQKDGEHAVIALRLRIFRGGNIDARSWKVGSKGKGVWVRKPRTDFEKEFEWVVRKIDRSRDM